jgi:uncharacterized protein DUF6174
MPMRAAAWKLLAGAVLVTAVACANATSPGGSGSSTPTPTGPPTDLASAQAAWQSAAVGSYALSIQTECFCAPQDYRTVIADDGSVQKGAPEDYLPQTVDDLFAIIQKGYDSNAVTVEVTYNEAGVPLHIFIDQSKNVADEEIGYKVAFDDLSG